MSTEPCPNAHLHGNPHRYCGYCDWMEEPAPQMPSVGRIVHYTLADADAASITYERKQRPPIPSGNFVAGGQVYPAVIVRVWGNGPEAPVNLRVLLDGPDDYWATSRVRGDGPGTWAWPERV